MKASKITKIAFKLDAIMSSGFGKTLQEADNKFSQLGDRLTSIGKGLTLGVTAPLVAVGAAAVNIGADFDSSLGNIQARTGMTAAEIDELGASLRGLALSGDYGAFTAREVAGAFGDVAVAGQGAEQSTELMRSAMVFATATSNDLSNAAYFLGNYLNKVGKDSSYSEKYINMFAQGVANTGISLADMQKYMFNMTPAFNQFGASSEANVAIMTRLYQAGIRGADLYSGMGSIMMDFGISGGMSAAMLERFGVSMHDANGQVRSNKDLMFETAMAMRNYGDQTAVAQFITANMNQTQSDAWFEFVLLAETIKNDVIPGFYEATAAVDGTGRAFEMAAIQQDGMHGSAAQVRASLEEISLTIGETLMPHAQRLVDIVGSVVSWFANLDDETQQNIIRFGVFAAAVGPVLMVTGKLVKTVGAAKTAFASYKATITAAKTVSGLMAKAEQAKAAATVKSTAATEAAKIAAHARAVASSAEKAALKLAAQADAVKAVAGANSAKAAALAEKADIARKTATTLSTAATEKAIIAEKAQAVSNKVSVAALKHETAAKNANTLASTKLGKATALLNAQKVAAAAKTSALSVSLTAFAAKQTALTASTKTATVAKGALALGAKGLSVAFAVMSKAIMAIPVFGWILAAVTGVIAAVALLVTWLNRTGEEYKALGDEAEQLLERQQQLTESAANAGVEFERNTRIMQTYHSQLDSVADRTEHLTAMQAANRVEMDRLGMEAIELNMELEDVQARRMEMEAQLNDGSRRSRSNRRALEDAINDLIAAEEGYSAALDANAGQLANVNNLYNENVRALEDIASAQQEAAIEAYGLEMAMRRQAFSAEEWADAQEKALDRMNASFENYKRITTNVFSTVNENAAVSVSELTTNLISNAMMVEEWSKDMAILTERGLDEGLIEQLRQAGPEAAATVRGLVDASYYELEALNYAFADSTRVAVESMQRELDPMGVTESAEELIDKVAITLLENQAMEDALIAKVNNSFEAFSNTIDYVGFDSAGYTMTTSTAQGISDGTINIINASRQAAALGIQAMRDELEMNSPSKKALAIGATYTDSVAMGMYSKESVLKAASEDMMYAVTDGMSAKAGIVEKACKNVSKLMAKNLHVDAPGFGDTAYEIPNNVIPFPGAYKAHSTQARFDRFTNLVDDEDASSPASSPLAAIQRFEDAVTNYQGDALDFHFENNISINGSGHSIEKLERMMEKAMKKSGSDFEQMVNRVIEDREDRFRRVANA